MRREFDIGIRNDEDLAFGRRDAAVRSLSVAGIVGSIDHQIDVESAHALPFGGIPGVVHENDVERERGGGARRLDRPPRHLRGVVIDDDQGSPARQRTSAPASRSAACLRIAAAAASFRGRFPAAIAASAKASPLHSETTRTPSHRSTRNPS